MKNSFSNSIFNSRLYDKLLITVSKGQSTLKSGALRTRIFRDVKYMHEYLLIKQTGVLEIDLDAGCGDGYLSSLLFRKIRLGLDLDRSVLTKAQKRGVYENLLNASITHLPLRDGYMNYVLCNSVIGQVDPISMGVKELARSVSPGGFLILTTLTKYWTDWLFFATVLPTSWFQRVRKRYVRFMNRYLGPILTILDFDEWVGLLRLAGLDVVKYRYYLGRFGFLLFEIEVVLEILLIDFFKVPRIRWLVLRYFKKGLVRLFTLVDQQRITASVGSCIFMIVKKKYCYN